MFEWLIYGCSLLLHTYNYYLNTANVFSSISIENFIYFCVFLYTKRDTSRILYTILCIYFKGGRMFRYLFSDIFEGMGALAIFFCRNEGSYSIFLLFSCFPTLPSCLRIECICCCIVVIGKIDSGVFFFLLFVLCMYKVVVVVSVLGVRTQY